MTVRELIERLKTFPPDLPVVVPGYEWGWGRIIPGAVKVVELKQGWEEDGNVQRLSALGIDREFIKEDHESYGAKWEEGL